MEEKISKFLDVVSDYLAHRKGLLLLVGIIFVALNFVAQFLPLGWLSESDLLLHVGVILAILGVLLAWAL